MSLPSFGLALLPSRAVDITTSALIIVSLFIITRVARLIVWTIAPCEKCYDQIAFVWSRTLNVLRTMEAVTTVFTVT